MMMTGVAVIRRIDPVADLPQPRRLQRLAVAIGTRQRLRDRDWPIARIRILLLLLLLLLLPIQAVAAAAAAAAIKAIRPWRRPSLGQLLLPDCHHQQRHHCPWPHQHQHRHHRYRSGRRSCAALASGAKTVWAWP